MELIVNIRNVYGADLIYPACQKSELFVKLLKQTTFTERDVQLIKQLGYKFILKQPEVLL